MRASVVAFCLKIDKCDCPFSLPSGSKMQSFFGFCSHAACGRELSATAAEILIIFFSLFHQIPLWLDFGSVLQFLSSSCFLSWPCWRRQEHHIKSESENWNNSSSPLGGKSVFVQHANKQRQCWPCPGSAPSCSTLSLQMGAVQQCFK